MAKTLQGSAFYDDFGGCVFTPFETGKPESVNWLPLRVIDGAKLECSKKKIRITITLNRGDIGSVCSSFSSKCSKLITALMTDKRIQRLYERAKDLKPCEIKDDEDEEIPMHG